MLCSTTHSLTLSERLVEKNEDIADMFGNHPFLTGPVTSGKYPADIGNITARLYNVVMQAQPQMMKIMEKHANLSTNDEEKRIFQMGVKEMEKMFNHITQVFRDGFPSSYLSDMVIVSLILLFTLFAN